MVTIQLVECRLKKAKTIKLPRGNVTCLEDALAVLRYLTSDLPVEQFIVLGMNNAGMVSFASVVSQGGVEGCAIKPRDVFRALLIANATSFIVGHNHPSGDPTPSAFDLDTNSCLVQAGQAIGLPLVDSIIVAGTGQYWSAAEEGAL